MGRTTSEGGRSLHRGHAKPPKGDAADEYPNWSIFKDELGKGQYPPSLFQFNEIGDIVGRTADAIIRCGRGCQGGAGGGPVPGHAAAQYLNDTHREASALRAARLPAPCPGGPA